MDGGAKRPGNVGEGKENEGRRKWYWRKRSLEANRTREAIRGTGICPRWMKPFRASRNQSRV